MDDRYGLDARVQRLERALEGQRRELDRLEHVVRGLEERTADRTDALARALRQVRATVQQLDDRDKWVDSFRADQRDPFTELGRRGD